MKMLRNMLSGGVAILVLTTGALAQTNYQPGQTFSAGGNANPTPAAAQPQQEVNLPVYAPVQQRVQPATQQRQPQSQVPQQQMYNMSNSNNAPRSAANASSTARKADEPAAKSAKTSSRAASAPEKKQITKTKTAESEEKKSEPEVKPEVAVAEEAHVTPKPEEIAQPDSADKLVFSERKTGKKLIALTYDDGPNPAFTPRLVEYLKANKVPATFYLCGNMVKEYPDTVKQLAADGFELANHSYDHPNLQKLSREKVLSQLQDTHDLIKEHTGVDVKTMRPPYGAMNNTVKDVCEAMGYKIILWDVDTEDWRKRSTAQMMNTISKLTGDGSIILMHDRKHGGKDTVLETTKQTVEKYRAQGYTFVTVTELIGMNETAVAEPAAPVVVPGPLGPMNPATTATAAMAGGSLPAPAIVTPAPATPAVP